MEDGLFDGLMDHYISMPNAVTSETLGAKYGVTRYECDQWALRSQQRWKAGEYLNVVVIRIYMYIELEKKKLYTVYILTDLYTCNRNHKPRLCCKRSRHTYMWIDDPKISVQ